MKKRYIIAFIITLGILWLTNPYWIIFKSKSHAHFEFYIFTIILICGYLLSLKITEYLADFKTLKNQSRIEIIFLTIFFGMLFIPMSHIDTRTVKSVSENRNLATYKPFFDKEHKINYSFGKDFNNWFNDRFYFRMHLVYLNKYLLYYSNNRFVKCAKNKEIDKYNNFLYYEGAPLDKVTLDNSLHYLKKLNKFCNNNNIKLYTLIVPKKEQVYMLPSYKKQVKDNLLELIHKPKYANLNIIYPLEELKKASNNQYTYFKTEHHWTDDGAFIGYLSVMNKIKKDYPQVKTLDYNDFNYRYNYKVQADWDDNEFRRGQTCDNFALPNFLCSKSLDVKYRYFDYKDASNLKKRITEEEFIRHKNYFYDKGADIRVVLLGTSMGENLAKFIPYSFKNTKRIRTNEVIGIINNPIHNFKIMKYHKYQILNYKPDIIIFCITYSNIPSLVHMFER